MSRALHSSTRAAVRPWLLDLFCGAGGVAKGYQQAGFYVVGVDIEPQPNYCGDGFVQRDALEFMDAALRGDVLPFLTYDGGYDETWLPSFAAVHASPPCQAYAGSTAWRGSRESHPALIAPTRERLALSGLPYVIENVPDARWHLRNPLMLCGTSLGLRVRRHRYFELSWPRAWLGEPCLWRGEPCLHRRSDFVFDHGGKQPESVYRDAMECDWMTVRESREAIPPTYTRLIGRWLMQHVRNEVVAA